MTPPDPSSTPATAPGGSAFVSVGVTPPPAFPAPNGAPLKALVRIDGESEELPGLTALGPVAGERKARDWALVLQSMSIWHAIRRSYAGWVVLVRDGDYRRAAHAIDHYEAENRDWPPPPVRERARHMPSIAIPLLFVALAAFFLVTGPVAARSPWFARGIAESQLVLSSKPWLAVTALTLHADTAHLLGNAISGTVFASAVSRRLGPGGATLAILASGALGNVANAAYQLASGHADHRSLGASTAIFGAIGLLAATQLVLAHKAPSARRSWLDLAAPLVGGLALLGALGAGGGAESGGRTDLGAHLFGFLAGALIGLVVAVPLRRSTAAVDMGSSQQSAHAVELGAGRPSAYLQATLGAIAAAIVVIAWQLALRR